MFTILLHSSKTMRPAVTTGASDYQKPALLHKARDLAAYIQGLSIDQLATHMKLSPDLAAKTHQLWHDWTPEPSFQRPALDSFLGDIYSGLQVESLSQDDRDYANHRLIILSGLYGALRALDGIYPYRLEMGYRLPNAAYNNLYTFWNGDIASLLPRRDTIINLSAVEYTKAVLPHALSSTVITPKFLTLSPKTNQPMFVTVHAKIARGAFANWLIVRRIDTLEALTHFDELGYVYDPETSTLPEPVFIAKKFNGLGLSVRKS